MDSKQKTESKDLLSYTTNIYSVYVILKIIGFSDYFLLKKNKEKKKWI